MCVYIYIYPLFWISFPFRSPQSTEYSSLCCYSRFSLVIYFIHSIISVYMSTSVSQFIPLLIPLSVSTYLFSRKIAQMNLFTKQKQRHRRVKKVLFSKVWSDLVTFSHLTSQPVIGQSWEFNIIVLISNPHCLLVFFLKHHQFYLNLSQAWHLHDSSVAKEYIIKRVEWKSK